MSTPNASDAAAIGTVDPAVAGLYEGASFGDKAELDAIFNEEFGLPAPETPADAAAAAIANDGEKPAAAAGAAAKPKDAAQAEDPDVKAIREINARSRARREAMALARAAAAPVAVAPAPAPSKAETPAAPAPVADSVVTKAVSDVLREIQQLTADAEKPAADATPKDERAAALLALQGRLEEIAKGATVNADLQKKLDDATARLGAVEKAAHSRDVNARYITEKVRPILDELPLLRAHHPTLEEPRTALELIEALAGRYVQKFKVVPDMQNCARRIEKYLQPAGAETKHETPPTPKSKTVSSKLGSPPAARSGPDKRTKEEVEADLWKAFDLAPDS